jgi:hypothetical protein
LIKTLDHQVLPVARHFAVKRNILIQNYYIIFVIKMAQFSSQILRAVFVMNIIQSSQEGFLPPLQVKDRFQSVRLSLTFGHNFRVLRASSRRLRLISRFNSLVSSSSSGLADEATDVCQDGGCMKRVITRGKGSETPRCGDFVQIRYKLEANGQVLSSNKDSENCFEFELVTY